MTVLTLISQSGYAAGCAEYERLVTGNVGVRRLRDALWIARNVDAAAMGHVASWRRRSAFAVANLFREGYLTAPNFGALRGGLSM
jgi:hypothetical protein